MDSTQKIITENPDSITIGTAAKGGQVKVYGDFSNLKEFKEKIDNSKAVREYVEKIMTPLI